MSAFLLLSTAAFGSGWHGGVPPSCTPSDEVHVDVLVPGINDEIGPDQSTDDDVLGLPSLGYALANFAGSGADGALGSVEATLGRVGNLATFDLVPYALVEYYLDCAAGPGAVSPGTLTRWQRLDRSADLALDLPAVFDRLHRQVRAVADLDPEIARLLAEQRPDLGRGTRIRAPLVVSEWPTWDEGGLTVEFRVVKAEEVRGWCPGVPTQHPVCGGVMARSEAERRFVYQVDRRGVVSGPVPQPATGSVRTFSPPPRAGPAPPPRQPVTTR